VNKSEDENDKLRRGALPNDPKNGAKPMNGAAKAIDDAKPRIGYVDEMLTNSMTRAFAPREKHERCTSGVRRLDHMTGGIQRGHTWVLGAESTWGKSTFTVGCIDENLKIGKRVLVVTNEDPEELYADRLMQRRARINATRLRDGALTMAEQDAIKDAVFAAKGQHIPIYLDARKKEHRIAEWVAGQVAKMLQEDAIDVVVYDYLQEFDSKKRFQDERLKFKDIAATLRSVVKSAGKAAIILSQVTEMQGKKYPDKNSIRDCRDVSNAAEVVIIGFTPKEGEHTGEKCLLIDKVKNGPRGAVLVLEWDSESACFGARPGNAENQDDSDERHP
jgi:replicative DNA helicase